VLYGRIAVSRFRRGEPYRSRLPVVCIGNFTAGGTGKTPLSMFVARLLLARGEKPVFLTRGYGGSTAGPAWVRDADDAARRYGDEPLLLASVAPTVVARDRKAGMQCIERGEHPATVVIMDDGLQNPALTKDLSIAVVDGTRGLGNGEVIPAGPLRAPVDFQMGLVDAVVVREPQQTANSGDGIHALLRRAFPGPVLAANVIPRGDTAWLRQGPLVAFAGIANPQRFYDLVARLGGSIAARASFPDHHAFTAADAERLLTLAREHGARLVTTEKDWVRLASGSLALGELKLRATPLAIELALDERSLGRLNSLIDAVVVAPGARA
jgi:tetraacyldisaccharide 4'-kinase